MRSSLVRRLPIPARLLVTLGVPVFALCAVLGSQVTQARNTGSSLRLAIAQSAVLQAAADLQSCVVEPETVQNGLTPERIKKADLASQITLNTILQMQIQDCVKAQSNLDSVVKQHPGAMPAEANAAFSAEEEALQPVLAGDFSTAAIQRLSSARNAADDALTDMFLAVAKRVDWFVYQGVIELQRARYNQSSAVLTTLAGIGVLSGSELSVDTGILSNAITRSKFGTDAATRAQIDAVVNGEAYQTYLNADAIAVAIAAGKHAKMSGSGVNQVGAAALTLIQNLLDISDRTEAQHTAELEAEALHADRSARLALIIAGATLLATLLLAMAALQSIVKPLRELTRRAKELAAGDVEGNPVPLTGRDELTRLAQAMEQGASTLLHVNRQAQAMADGRLDDPSLETAAPGKFGEVLHQNVRAMQNQATRLRHDADHDSLTGLLNRKALVRAASRAVTPEIMSGASVRWLLYLDLDGFKQINDLHGHEQGDDVLRAVSERLNRSVRPGDLVARLGGDEFAVLLTVSADTSEHDLDQSCNRIAQAITLPVPRRRSDHESVSVGVSIGRALVPSHGVTFEEAMAAADALMYQNKKERKERKAREAAREGRMLDLTDIHR